MRMERLLHQFIQDYLMSTSSNCLLLVLVFALSIVLLFYWESSLGYFRGTPSPIPSLMFLWSLWSRPRLTCVDEVNSHNQSTSCQMISSLSPPSSSSHAPRIKYDVFISFRGSDTRRGFVSHLLKALSRAKIEVFVDYKLREGDELSSTLFTAIEESQIALIIFSEDYASSKWCLEELVKITECMTKNGQIVVPIFYNVDPSEVRHQKGCYENAFAKLKKLLKGNTMNLEKWKTALNKVANISGFHYKNVGTEAKLIEKVVQRLLRWLNRKCQVNLEGLIGIDKPIADLERLICCTGSDVRIIGIWGMGGIGKTTIAGALFSILSSEYEGSCFLANVRVELEKYGIIQLKSKLISLLLEEKDLNIDIPNGVPDDILSRLRRKKVFIVLDDVNDSDQVTNLIGGHDWLGSGSRIIVTTRDKHVVHKAKYIYEVEALGCDDALKLLDLHAFDNGIHLQKNWHELMMKVIEYANGLPLALKVLGSFLYGKSAEEWESQLHKLQKMPFREIQAVLRLSYEGLDEEEKRIFLYIACFFNSDVERYEVKALLDACDYSTSIALRNLQDKALIEVSRYEDVSMHDLIREMGRQIVREQNSERPWKRSHLCVSDDIFSVLKHDEWTKRIEAIALDISRVSDLRINAQSFAGMVNLKLLRFYNPTPYAIRIGVGGHILDYGRHSGVHLPEGLETLSNNLRLFHWDQCPSKSFPATFIGENLVVLRMRGSRFEKLWDGAPNLANLKRIDLEGSELVELPDFSKASSLEHITLDWCVNFISIHPSIFRLQRLKEVSLRYCERLEELPDIEALPSSDSCSTLRYLNLRGCKCLKYLPDSLSKLRSLSDLILKDCLQLDTSNLQNILDGLLSLTSLYLDSCPNLFELPENISKLSSLEALSLKRTSIISLPESIKHLPRLRCLKLRKCWWLLSIPEIPASLTYLDAYCCTSLEELFTPTTELLEQHIIASESYEFPMSYFSFDVCPNLDEDAHDAVLTYVECCNERKCDRIRAQLCV